MANWWEDNILISPVSEIDAQISLKKQRDQEFEAKRIKDAEQKLDYGQGVVGDTMSQAAALVKEWGADTGSMLARAVGQDELADEANRNAAAVEQVIREKQAGGPIPDWLQNAVRGGLRSVPPIVIGGRFGAGTGSAVGGATGQAIGGYAGSVGTAMAMEGNQAITEGRDAGLQGAELAAYAASQGAIEGAIASVFQAVGMGGAESMFARDAISGGVREATKQAAVRLGQEIPEEVATEIAHAIAADYANIRPDGLTGEELGKLALETTLSTIVTMGAMETPRIAGAALRPAQPGQGATPEQLAELAEMENVQRERERLVKEQEQGQQPPAEQTQPVQQSAVPPAGDTVSPSNKVEDIAGAIGGMGKGIVDGLYKKIWDDAQSGKLETMDKPPLFEQMVLAGYKRGVIRSEDDVRSVSQGWTGEFEKDKTVGIGNLNKLVEKYKTAGQPGVPAPTTVPPTAGETTNVPPANQREGVISDGQDVLEGNGQGNVQGSQEGSVDKGGQGQVGTVPASPSGNAGAGDTVSPPPVVQPASGAGGGRTSPPPVPGQQSAPGAQSYWDRMKQEGKPGKEAMQQTVVDEAEQKISDNYELGKLAEFSMFARKQDFDKVDAYREILKESGVEVGPVSYNEKNGTASWTVARSSAPGTRRIGQPKAGDTVSPTPVVEPPAVMDDAEYADIARKIESSKTDKAAWMEFANDPESDSLLSAGRDDIVSLLTSDYGYSKETASRFADTAIDKWKKRQSQQKPQNAIEILSGMSSDAVQVFNEVTSEEQSQLDAAEKAGVIEKVQTKNGKAGYRRTGNVLEWIGTESQKTPTESGTRKIGQADPATTRPAGTSKTSVPKTETPTSGKPTGDTVSPTPVVDKNGFAKFAPESGSLGIPRAEMPQVKSEQRGALANFARARGVEYERVEVLPTDLKPSQAEYSPEKVQKAREFEGPERAILVSKDGYVVDGHHQWQRNVEDRPGEPMEVIRLGTDAKAAIDLVREFPSSQTSDETGSGPRKLGQPEPASGNASTPEAIKGAYNWRQQDGESRAKYRKRLRDQGWQDVPKPSMTVSDSPGVVLRLSIEQLKSDPYKAGDRVIVSTGYANDEMSIGAEVLEDTSRGNKASSVRVRLDDGSEQRVSAYYTAREKPASGDTVSPAKPATEFEADRDTAVAKVKKQWGQTVVPREPKNADEQDQIDFLRSRGKKASFVDGDDNGFSGALDEITGFMLIAGNRDANDIWRTIGHELAHETKLDKIIPMDSAELAAGREKRLARAKGAYKQRLESEPELLDREARADIVGEFMRDKAFRDKLSKDNPTLWDRLREAVLKVVGKWTPRNEAQALVLEELRKQPATRKLGQPAGDTVSPETRPDLRTRAIEELRREGKRNPSEGDIENKIRQLSDDAAATSAIRQDIDDARRKEQDRQAFREYWDGVDLPPATRQSMSVGDIGQVIKDIERNRVTAEQVLAVAEDAVAKKFMPEGQLGRLRGKFPESSAQTVESSEEPSSPEQSDSGSGESSTGSARPGRDSAAAQDPELDEADIDAMMESLFDEELGTKEQAPEPAAPPRKLGQPKPESTAPQSPAEPKPKTNIEQARDNVRKKKEDLYKQWNDEANGKLTSGLDPSLAKLAFQIAVAEIQDGTLTFAAYVENVANSVSAELLDKAKPYFESAWRIAHKRGMTEEPAGKFDDVLEQSQSSDSVSQDSPPRKLGDVDYGTVDNPNRIALGDHFAERFRDGVAYARITDARKEAAELIGEAPKDGTQAIKAIDESVELGVVIAAREIAQSGEPDAAIYDQLVDLYSRQPNLGTKTSTSMLEQAYSTPAPLAFLVNRQAGITRDDTVYDSSAGNGMLLIVGGKRIANEINKERAAALESQGIETTINDAAEFTLGKPITALAINPPFNKHRDGVKQWNIDGVRTDKVDHAITLNSLKEIPENGKVAIIIAAKGFENREPKGNRDRGNAYLNGKGFYDAVYDNYNVVDHYTVHGDLYSRQGAAFPVDVIIIEGRGSSSRPKPYNILGGGIPQVYESWQELKDAKLLGNKQQVDGADSRRPTDNPQTGVPPKTRGDDESRPAGQREGGGGDVQSTPPGGRRLGERDDVGGSSETPGVRGQDQRDVGKEPRTRDQGGRGERRTDADDGRNDRQRTGDTQDSDAGRDGLKQGEQAVADKESESKGDQYQTTYTPGSSNRSVDALIPNNHQSAVQSSLDAVAEKYGNIDDFVAKELGIDKNRLYDAFSAEQVDALALGVARHKEGKAFILGDQTGVGKGRVAAGMLAYAKKQGFAPVFMTEKPTLYADIMRDLIDIGFSTDDKPFNPLMTNVTSKKSEQITLPDGRILKQTSVAAVARIQEAVDNFIGGKGLVATIKKATKKTPAVTEEYDAIFTTYDQMVTQHGQLKERHVALQKLSPQAFFVLDESHNAGGSAQDGGRDNPDHDKIPVSEMIRDLIASETTGVYFSSGTFAKRHNVMDLYAKTGMTAATNNDGKKLAEAFRTGGVPLQQVVSQQLVESGAYLRREKSFDGIEFAPKVYEVSTDGAEQSSAIFRAINVFDKVKQQIISGELEEGVISEGGSIRPDWATGDAGITSTNFSSILWNLVDQMLVATKADAIADDAIAALQRGETPLIYIDSTMEAALDRFVDSEGLRPGDTTDFSFRHLLQRYLDRSREILVQRDVSDRDSYEQVRLTDEQLGPRGLEAFNAAQELIDNFDADMPASPIDWIRKRIEDAGYSMGEYTGRKLVMRYADRNTVTLENRPSDEAGAASRVEMVRKINSGELDSLLFNASGSTGISMHASAKNPPAGQKRRHMIIGQASKNIDTAMQAFGRINRTGQIVERDGKTNLPRFTLAMTNLPAEIRPASVLVKKLGSLNANVTASAKGSISFDVPDILNSIGDQIVAEYLYENEQLNRDLNEGRDSGLVSQDRNGRLQYDRDLARKASGRMALMPLAVQQEFWDSVTESFNETIAELDRAGANPLSAKVSEINAKTLESFPIFDGDPDSQSSFDRPAYIEKVVAKRLGKPFKPEEVDKKIRDFYGLNNIRRAPGVEAFDDMESEEFMRTLGANVKQRRFDDSRSIEDASREWVRGIVRQVQGEARELIQSLNDQIEDPDKLRRRVEKESEMFRDFNNAIHGFAPGTKVKVYEGGTAEDASIYSITGIVVGAKRKKGGHPSSMSKWQIEIAVASPDRVIKQSLSKLSVGSQDANADESGERSYETAVYSGRTIYNQDTLREFEDSVAEPTEIRHIGTGNILAAYDTFRADRGRVTFFTDQDGNLRRGVLLPRSFNVERWAEKLPVAMEDVSQIRQFLAAGNYLETPDRALNVMMIRGGLVVRAPKSKSRGGRYTLSPTILGASSPQEFVSIGSRMEMVIDDPAQQDSVLEAIMSVAPLQATSEKELARRIKNGDDNDDRPDVIRAFTASSTGNLGSKPSATVSPALPPASSPPPSQAATKKDAEPIRQADIVTTWSRLFGVPIKIGGYRDALGKGKIAAGIYKHLQEIVRMREGHAFNIIVASHEIGHHLDKKLNLFSGSGRTGVREDKDSKLAKLKKDDPAMYVKVKGQLQALDYDHPKTSRAWEGVAEAVRQIITGTAVNARLAPDAVAWVEEQIMADSKFGPAMKQAVEQAKQYQDQGAIKRAQAVFGGAPIDLNDKVRRRNILNRAIAKTYEGFVERRYTLNLVDADIAAKKPLEPGEATIHEMVTVFDSRVNAMSAKALQDGIHTIDGEKISEATIPKAQELLKKGEYTADADAYMVARFGLTFPASYNFGMDRQDAQEYVDWVESDADRGQRWQDYHKLHSEYFNALVELEVRDGDLSREEADRIMGTNKALYVPLMREMGSSRFSQMIGGGGQMIELPKRFRRRTQSGSGRPVMPIIQQAVLRTRHHYSRVVRQQIHNKIVDQITSREGLGKWLSRIDPKTAIEGGKIEAILQQLVEQGIVDPEFAFVLRQAQKAREGGQLRPDDLDRLAEYYEIEQTTDIVAQEDEVRDRLSLEPDITEAVLFYKPDYRRPNGMYVIKYMRGDKPELYEVDPDFYDTLLGLPQETHSFYISAADWINSKFKTGAVGVNTSFAVSELARNVQTFAVNSKYATGSDRVTKTVAWTADYVAAITHLPLVHRPNELVEVYREWGGELYNYISPNAEGAKKTARRLGSSANRKKFASVPDAYHTLADGMEDMIDRVRVLAAVSDVGPRLAEAEAYLKTQGFEVKDGKFVDTKTGDPKMPSRDQFIKAMYAAADVTYNYRRTGKWIRPIERIFPFSNAAIQALDKRVRTYRETLQGLGKKKGAEREVAKQAFLAMMAISTLYAMIKWAMMDEEEELDQWEKDGYLTVKVPGIDGRLTVAMSREHAWLSNGALAGIRYFAKDEKDALRKYFRQEFDNTVPFGASGAVGTSVEALMNFDTHRWQPIEPNYMRYGESAVSPKYRFNEHSTEFSKFLGKANVLSPMMIDHLLSGFTGGAYERWSRTGEKIAVPLLQALGTAEKADTQPWSFMDAPGLRAVYRDNTPNASVNEFYDEMDRLSLEMNNMKAEGQVPPTEMIERSEMLSQAADVMRLLRESSGPEYDSSENQVAIARDVLGKSDHANYPNPFYTDIPEEAVKKIREMVFNDLDNLSRDLGKPGKSEEQSDQEYADKIRVLEAKQEGIRKYWERHADSPIVQEAIKSVKTSKAFRELLQGKGKPERNLGEKPLSQYREETRRFGAGRDAAREFLQFGQGAE